MNKLTPIALSLALALPAVASAQSSAELQSQIEALKAQISELKKSVESKPAASGGVDMAEFNRMRVKVEAMEDAQEASGFNGLKVSGFIDPTYIYNQRANRGSFIFLNTADGSANDLTTDAFGYDNSNFGGASIRFDKEFDSGVSAYLTLRPEKSGSGSIVEEALATIPLSGGVNLIAGKQISWNGYEYVNAPDMKNITHNLLFDFGGPYYVVGAGLTFNVAGMDFKTLVGNLNGRNLPGDSNQGLHWRGDYEISEFTGFGITGMHGKIANTRYNYLGADWWYAKGDLSLNAQLEGSDHRDAAYNGGKASHFGASFLAAYKFAPQWEAVARADWLDNHKNGGGGAGRAFGDTVCDNASLTTDSLGNPLNFVDPDDTSLGYACGDYRNGFGPGMIDDGTGIWIVKDINEGSKRSAFTLGLNYQLYENALLKFELRHDRSNQYSFLNYSDNTFKKYNNTLGVQTVVKF